MAGEGGNGGQGNRVMAQGRGFMESVTSALYTKNGKPKDITTRRRDHVTSVTRTGDVKSNA